MFIDLVIEYRQFSFEQKTNWSFCMIQSWHYAAIPMLNNQIENPPLLIFLSSNFLDRIFGYCRSDHFHFQNIFEDQLNRGNFCPEISMNLSRCLNSCVSNIGDKLNVMQKRLIEMICLVQGNEIFGRYLHHEYGDWQPSCFEVFWRGPSNWSLCRILTLSHWCLLIDIANLGKA